MKRPATRSVYATIIGVLILAIVTTIVFYNRSDKHFFEEGENEERESPAEVFGSFDMWSNMRSYPDTSFSKAAYFTAFKHGKALGLPRHAPGAAGARVEALSPWVPLAPKNFSGRILCLAFDPTNANIMFAGSASGGLWKTTTGGTGGTGGISWQQVATGFPILGVPAIAINPANHLEMYIGTGEVYNSGAPGTGLSGFGISGQDIRTFRGSYGVGILKSIDGGITWTQSLPFTNSSIKGVQKIIIDPNTPANVYAATSDGLYRSANSGGSWTLIHSVVMSMDICIYPTDASIIYEACGNFGSAGSGIYKITNPTAATPTITQLTSGLPSSASITGMIRLSICPNNASLLYASIGKKPGTGSGTSGVTFGLFKSTNAGASWAATTQPTLSGLTYIYNQGWYAHDVLVGPSGTNVYVSEIDMARSTNSGSTFSQITDWSKWDFSNTTVGATTEGTATNYVHADHHHLYFAPGSTTTLFVVCDGGVFKSTNSGTSWIGLNGGLMTTQIYHSMSISATNSNYMLCGLQDNATLWYQGNPGCQRTTVGDGFYTAIDPTNDQICFGEYSYFTLYRSTTGPGGLRPSPTAITSNALLPASSTPTEDACFVAPFVIAPSDHNRMYGGTIYFKKSTDNGQTWSNVPSTPVVDNSAPIISIAVSKTYADSVYIATCPSSSNNPKILLSVNGGTSFTNVTGTLPNRYFSYVAVDPKNSKRVAVAVSGFGTSHLYLTTNAGATWTSISGTGATALPDVPANVVMFDPNNPTNIYVGNDLGVYLAQGVTTGAVQPVWYTYNTGLTDATMVMDMLVAPNGKLRLGTYGKGLWENDLVSVSLPVILEDFTVRPTDKGNQLKWTVTDQVSLDHYDVEYSTDGIHFTKIAAVPAASGRGEITYSYLHQIRNRVTGYYRIKMVDMDNTFEYSPVREVKADVPAGNFAVYPNPTSGAFKVVIPAGSGTVDLALYDAAGKMLLLQHVSLQSSVTEVSMDIGRLPAGMYRLVGESGKTRWTSNVLKR